MKNAPEMKIEYVYMEPKTKEEAEKAKQRLIAAYDILFEATLEQLRKNDKEGIWSHF